MSDTCAVCSVADGRHNWDECNDSSVGTVRLCGACDAWLRRRIQETPGDRCVVCGGPSGRHEAVFEQGDVDGAGGPLCTACRHKLTDPDRTVRPEFAAHRGVKASD